MTHILKRKLRSQTGASLILALVFLMFCTFVGGTVLVSATSNAYRVQQLSSQQDFLTERSTALLLTDELQLNDLKQTVDGVEVVVGHERLQMTVVDSLLSIQEVVVTPQGSVVPVEGADPVLKRVITFQVYTTDVSINPAQRLMLEATVWRYIREYPDHPQASGGSITTSYQLEAFPAGGSPLDPSNLLPENSGLSPLWLQFQEGEEIHGSVQITSSNPSLIPAYTMYFSSGKGTELYDFFFDVGEASHMKMVMDAFSGTTEFPATVAPPVDDGTTCIQTTTTTIQTIISWADPKIEKGSASVE